jgi:aspartokinase
VPRTRAISSSAAAVVAAPAAATARRVCKFGGSSVAGPAQVEQVLALLRADEESRR